MDNVEVSKLGEPGFGLVEKRTIRETGGHGEQIKEADIHPGTRSALQALRDQGLGFGIADCLLELPGLLSR